MTAMHLICFGVALFAAAVGSLSGLGGGVIIKPSLDVMAADWLSLGEIGALSSVTVFSMAVLSTAKGARKGIKLDLGIFLPLAVSAALGGALGNQAFVKTAAFLGEGVCGVLQSVTLLVLMGAVLVLHLLDGRYQPLHMKKKSAVFLTGLILGAISAFLGIGGGPVNVVALKLLFDLKGKEQIFGSLFIILFAQGSKLISLAVSGGAFSSISLPAVMIAGGLLGGSLGSSMAIRLPSRSIRKVFLGAVILVIFITLIGLMH